MSKKGWSVTNAVVQAKQDNPDKENLADAADREAARQRRLLEEHDASIRVRQMSSPPLVRLGEILDKALKSH